jgi:hypothetical protein
MQLVVIFNDPTEVECNLWQLTSVSREIKLLQQAAEVITWFYNTTGLHLTKRITAQNKKTEYAEWSLDMSCIHSQVHNFEQTEGKTKPGNEKTKAAEF